MFRALLKNTTLKQNIYNALPKFRMVTTETPLENIKEEHNSVKLTGTIITNAKNLANGFKSIIVRTNETDDTYYNHQVNVKTDDLLKVGERIYIFGHLSSKQISLDDGRLRQKLTIKSQYHRLRGGGNDRKINDQNSVQIVGKISSDIRETDKYVLLTLSCSHTPKGDGRTPGIVITEFHRVIMYDQHAIGIARNLNKFDKILVEGKICYMPFTNSDNKKQHGGFITAEFIQRIE